MAITAIRLSFRRFGPRDIDSRSLLPGFCSTRASDLQRSCFGTTYTKIGTIQRRLAWPLRKDDTQIREAFHIFTNSQPESNKFFTVAGRFKTIRSKPESDFEKIKKTYPLSSHTKHLGTRSILIFIGRSGPRLMSPSSGRLLVNCPTPVCEGKRRGTIIRTGLSSSRPIRPRNHCLIRTADVLLFPAIPNTWVRGQY